ncbi:unnamed protein product [Polarella glacialis]|uniref:AAA+ ATPase domain-containing protein n=2 Tax=Polarella glacialis TaxID=89957 RepID=A0A813HTU6_POLGL|nr:unnamed protein product [Polarella glacialis]
MRTRTTGPLCVAVACSAVFATWASLQPLFMFVGVQTLQTRFCGRVAQPSSQRAASIPCGSVFATSPSGGTLPSRKKPAQHFGGPKRAANATQAKVDAQSALLMLSGEVSSTSKLAFFNAAPVSVQRGDGPPPVSGYWARVNFAPGCDPMYKHDCTPGLTLKRAFVKELGRRVWGMWTDAPSRREKNPNKVAWTWTFEVPKDAAKGSSISSPLFSCAVVPGLMRLSFYSAGDSAANDGYCSLFLAAANKAKLALQFFTMPNSRKRHILHKSGPLNFWSDTAPAWGYDDWMKVSKLPVVDGVVTIGVTVSDVRDAEAPPHDRRLLAYLDDDVSNSWFLWHGHGWSNAGEWGLQPVESQHAKLGAASPADLTEALHLAATSGHGLLVPAGLVQPLFASLQSDPATFRDPTSAELRFEQRLRGLFVHRPELKEKMRGFYGQLRLEQEMRRRNLSTTARTSTKHMAFVGNPGTGKTMFARELGRLMKDLGILSNGHVVEVQRGDLVAKWIGATAPLTRKAIERAAGGILFVDEAYRLTETDSANDFGIEALEEIMSVLEDSDDLAVVLAGYPGQMEDLMKSNPGLKRRIHRVISFKDYTPDQLASIFEQKVASRGYRLDTGIDASWLSGLLKVKCPQNIRATYNGGLCDCLLISCQEALSSRIVPEEASDTALTTFIKEDIASALESFVSGACGGLLPGETPAVGF